MGYILPVQYDQYTQYANRTVPVKHKYYQLQKVMKPTIKSKLDEEQPMSMQEERKPKQSRSAAASADTYARTKREEVFAELTGKGRLINEVI